MTLDEFIRSYHRLKLVPVFKTKTHGNHFRERITNYDKDPLDALTSFATEHGFIVKVEHGDFRFIPAVRPDDYDEYVHEYVPIDKYPDAQSSYS